MSGYDMNRHYYVEKEFETAETSDRFEAARIAAVWIERGYVVETVVVDVTDDAVQVVTDMGAEVSLSA